MPNHAFCKTVSLKKGPFVSSVDYDVHYRMNVSDDISAHHSRSTIQAHTNHLFNNRYTQKP